MITVVYADVLILINFCVDFICLYFTARLCGAAVKSYRLIAGAAFGAVYAFLTLFYSLPIVHLAAGLVVCVIVFGYKPLKRLIKSFVCFVLFAALLGGIFTAVYNMTASTNDFIFAVPLAAIAAFLFFKAQKNKLDVKTARLILKDDKLDINVPALIDSGNLLNDPLSGDAVILIKRKLLPPDFDITARRGYHPIPASGIGKSLLFAFRPKAIMVKPFLAKHWDEKRAVIAVDEADGSYAGYDAIIPKTLI